MKQLYAISFILFLLGGCTPTDETSPAPEDIFVKYYGAGQQEVVGLVTTSTGEYIILASQILGGTDRDFFLVKADAEGNQIASATFDINSGSDDIPVKIKSLGNDEFALLGTVLDDNAAGIDSTVAVWALMNDDLEITSNAGAFFTLPLGIDTDGNGVNDNSDLRAADLTAVNEPDGSRTFILMATTTRKLSGDGTPGTGDQIYVSKRSEDNTQVWRKTLGLAGNDLPLALFEKADGNLVIIGSTEASKSGFTGRNLLFWETNSLATFDRSGAVFGVTGTDENTDRNPATDANDVVGDVIQTPFGYTIVGTTTTNLGLNTAFLMSLTPTGTVLNSNVLVSDFNLATEGFAVARTISNEYLLAGRYTNYSLEAGDGSGGVNRQAEILVMRANQGGQYITGSEQNYGTSTGNDRARALVALPDGDVAMACTVDFGSNVTLIGLMKLNSRGELKD